jgi:xanthine dehydrogenase small subunit
VAFTCDGTAVQVEHAPGESLLTLLRERLGLHDVKDGCAPQGQCGCCTVLVDGEPRVACVTPAERVEGRTVTTLRGLDDAGRGALVDAFVATGASQCGFCTPGILVRLAALLERGRTSRLDVDRALAAHLCRCTGWQTIYEAFDVAAGRVTGAVVPRPLEPATARATLEGAVRQHVGPEVPAGRAGFADDSAPTDALVAVPLPPGVDPGDADARRAAGRWWVVDESLDGARARARKIQGRRTTRDQHPPLAVPEVAAPAHAVRLSTCWVEPAYLEPDASWCAPGADPASPLANGGAFGGKARSSAPAAARALADELGRVVRVVYSREDCVRLGPKRPPIAAIAWFDGDAVRIRGRAAAPFVPPDHALWSTHAVDVDQHWEVVDLAGPPVATADGARAVGHAEVAVLIEGAMAAAGVDAAERRVPDPRLQAVMLDTCVATDLGAAAGARVLVDPDTGAISGVEVRVRAGDPLDAIVLRSYCIGATHMALGWVCTEGLSVEPITGDVLDLTIRSFGVIRPALMPLVDVTIVDEPGPPRAVSDAVFAAVAAATWNAIARAEGTRPEAWPARQTRAGRALSR